MSLPWLPFSAPLLLSAALLVSCATTSRMPTCEPETRTPATVCAETSPSSSASASLDMVAPASIGLGAEALPPDESSRDPLLSRAVAGADRYGASAGDWELTLIGAGTSDKKFEAGGFNASASLGYFLTDHFEFAVRQSVFSAEDSSGDSTTNASTRGALDVNFGSGGFRPIIGVNVGYIYGDSVRETWAAAPEAGFKLYVKKDAFLQLLAEYQFFFNKGDEIDDQFDNGSFVYSLGFGVNF